MRRSFAILLAGMLVAGAATVAASYRELRASRRSFAHEAELAREQAERIRRELVLFTEQRIGMGVTFSETLRGLGIEPVTAGDIIRAARDVFDLNRVRAGARVEIGRSVEGELRTVRYHIDPERMLAVRAAEDGYEAAIETIPTTTELVTVKGEIRHSLFNAVTDTGESPELAIRLAEIFGWDLDFYNDPRVGDTFAIVVEKKSYLNGERAGYGRIFAAEYNNAGRPYQAVLFRDADGNPAYYSADGQSLQKAFLRSPLKFAAPISSHFSRSRLHPVLRVRRPHLGTDYAAPTGTPVQAIAAGRVTFAARSGGNGNMVRIQHSNGYETMYLHLSRILVRVGQRVAAGDRIGLVGMTGLATGPHLDFRIRQHGAYKNFEVVRRNLPPAEPVGAADREEFFAVRDEYMPYLQGGMLTASAGDAEAGAPAPAASD